MLRWMADAAVTYRFEVYGLTLEDLKSKADVEATRFFGGPSFRIDGIDVRTEVQLTTGQVILLRGNVVACQGR